MASNSSEKMESSEQPSVATVLKKLIATLLVFRQESSKIGSSAIKQNTSEFPRVAETESDQAVDPVQAGEQFRTVTQTVIDLLPKGNCCCREVKVRGELIS